MNKRSGLFFMAIIFGLLFALETNKAYAQPGKQGTGEVKAEKGTEAETFQATEEDSGGS